MTSGHDDDISGDEARMLARAGECTPGPDQADPEMTAEQIRALSRDTLAQAQQISHLLGKLAVLLEENPG